MSLKRVVAITGCDSGLGWALAARTAREGIVTVAGMYSGADSTAAKALKDLCAHPCDLDVTKPESVDGFRSFVEKLLKDNPDYRLYAIVNNAGVMTIGDFECQTMEMIEDTININLLGAMRIIKAFVPELKRTAALEVTVLPRVINVASHCGLEPLPGFGPYSASKAGLLGLNRALRLEYLYQGLSVVGFIPGGFVGASNLMSGQVKKSKIMVENLNGEQKVLHEKRIESLANYLHPIARNKRYDCLKDQNIIETFMQAINDKNPKQIYKVESWRYKFYYSILKLPLPECVRFWLINKFLGFPA